MKTHESKTSTPAMQKHTTAKSPFFSKAGNGGFDQLNDHVQAKLEVHPPDDIYEKEADSMADRVMQESAYAAQEPPMGPKGWNHVQTTPVIGKISRIQRQRAFESPTALEQNTSNQDMVEEGPLQQKSKAGFIQTKTEDANSETTSGIETALNSAKGKGAPLPEETRTKMESGFGADFSSVNIHTDQEAVRMNEQVGARAFTHGNDIYFNKGEYIPNTEGGDHLIAHELTHTLQQGAGVQRKSGNSIQRADVKKKKPIRSADQSDLDDVEKKRKDKSYPGTIKKNDKTVEIHLNQVAAKFYIRKRDFKFLENPNEPIKIKKPRQERDSNQKNIWVGGVKGDLSKKVEEKFDLKKGEIYSVELEGAKDKPQIFGDIDRIVAEIVIPFWNSKGKPGLFDVEHKVDYQIAGNLADDIDNLILLDRKTNRELGTEIEKTIDDHLGAVAKHYSDYFSGITPNPKATKNAFNVFIDDFKFSRKNLSEELYYENTEIKDASFLKFIKIEDAKIPKGFFLLVSSDKRAAYLLPHNATDKEIGGYKVTTKYKDDKLQSLELVPLVKDPAKITTKVSPVKGDTPFEEQKKHVYIAKTEKSVLGGALKGLIGGIKGASPIQLEDPQMEGFSIAINGKVISTLSILKDVDISFKYIDGEFIVKAEIPLAKLAASIPKPFIIKDCSIVLEASSKSGLSVSGNAVFAINGFGEGYIVASVGKGVEFNGGFDFNSKWFNPASISFNYKDGEWKVGGTIGIEAGVIKGVKSATLTIEYAKNTITASGDAKLDVPGVDSIKLSASYNEGAGFKFVATADLKKMPGIKSGSVTISILSKADGPIILGLGGTAEPDFPGVPGLNTSLTVFYEDGVFDMRAKVSYKKGKFDGTIEVGVTNKAVDEKGQPQGEPQKGNNVVVFGFGSLTVDLFKGSTGTISVRLTPDKQLLVAGSFSVKNLKPFGDGVNIHKKIVEFPSIKIPIIGVPGVSIFFEISGGAYFNFNWDPLVIKDITISFMETNINEIETAQVDIHGELGSKAVAEAYMEIKASLGAQVLVAVIKGSLAGDAGIGVEAEAGGTLDAKWNNEKGLQLKEITAFVAVNPKAIFKLKGSVSVDLDLWLTTINLYYKEWTLAEGAADLSGLSLKVNFPLKFDENGDLIRPGFEQLNIEKPDFSGEQGKAALDSGINSGAKEERKLAKDKLRNQIADDMRNSRKDDDFSPTEYAEKMKKKYNDDEDMKAFIMDSVEEEVKIQEYEEFEQLKNELRNADLTLNQKIGRAMVFKMFRSRITPGDYDAFITELQMAEQQKQEAAKSQTAISQPV